ncbi:S-layer homology domain-containing protein [Leptodesmis sichuanensis]|uniref:S-layer homology domain-containing protein n=1 Tax=Leptodesmis sichuanensis TaxID=2906798 RepID=UPI001F3C1383|nr:S-layer homology domain-containing protein [Leptodesmis sichuanensis]UIE37010.1 S-layer homology domain-containing protein [Leptodesmis sichuanensis A121]
MRVKNFCNWFLLPTAHLMAVSIIAPGLALEKLSVDQMQSLSLAQQTAQAINPASKKTAKPVNQADKNSFKKAAQSQEQGSSAPISATDMAELTRLFSDVQPGAWYYEPLKSLAERYGCISGYPNGTFQGQKFLTRSEFVAGLDACLNRLDAELKNRTANLVTRDQLAALFRILSSIFENNPGLRRAPGMDNGAPSPTVPPKMDDRPQPKN